MHASHHIETHQGSPVLHASWAGAWTRADYRRGVLELAQLAAAHAVHRVVLDLRELRGHANSTEDKAHLGCLMVALLPGLRCAVLLPKPLIQGVLAGVAASAGAPIRSFWNPATALGWVLED